MSIITLTRAVNYETELIVFFRLNQEDPNGRCFSRLALFTAINEFIASMNNLRESIVFLAYFHTFIRDFLAIPPSPFC